MAVLIINGQDFSENFSLKCNKCQSNKVGLDIDWAAYPSASWFKVSVICEECKQDETIFDY